MALFERLTASSTPQEIADAYAEFASTAGGDNAANQKLAVDYLNTLGVDTPAINQAYSLYTTPTTVVSGLPTTTDTTSNVTTTGGTGGTGGLSNLTTDTTTNLGSTTGATTGVTAGATTGSTTGALTQATTGVATSVGVGTTTGALDSGNFSMPGGILLVLWILAILVCRVVLALIQA